MLGRIRRHLTYANVMSTIAAFLALTGGIAWALAKNSVKSKHIVNEQVKAVDIEDGELPEGSAVDAVNATQLGGKEAVEYLDSKVATTDANTFAMEYEAHFLNTSTTGSSFNVGNNLTVENVGTADKFRVCAGPSGGATATVYVGGVRTQQTLATAACSSDFTIPDDGEFSISGGRGQTFGVFSGNIEDGYLVYSLLAG